MNDSIVMRPVWQFPFGAALVLMSVVALLMYSARALADAAEGYEYEYVRTDVPVSGIKRGQLLGTIYIKQQSLTVWRTVGSVESDPPIDTYVYSEMKNMGGGAPGCKPLADDNSIGFLRFTGSATETSCNYSIGYVIINGLKAFATHHTKIINGKYYFSFAVQIPRTKLADVVINDPAKALSHAGQAVLLTSLPDLYVPLNYSTATIYARTPLSVYIGETPPAVFFPQQNTSHAVLPVQIMSSGDMAAGSASLDMCLYDGVGLSDSRYMLLFSDESSGSAGKDFAMRRENGAGEISYSVSVTDPSGKPQAVANREPFYWNNMQKGGAAQSRVKYIQLPDGIQGTVPCVPSVVSVEVRPVRYSSLKAGHYQGKINILFTPST